LIEFISQILIKKEKKRKKSPAGASNKIHSQRLSCMAWDTCGLLYGILRLEKPRKMMIDQSLLHCFFRWNLASAAQAPRNKGFETEGLQTDQPSLGARQKALQATAAGTTYSLAPPAGVSMQLAGQSAISIISRRHGRYQQQCCFVWQFC
jgi:hypothetical protein